VIEGLLIERDAKLAAANWDGEDHELEVISSAMVDLQALINPYLG
jgi:hypothetical protein